MPVYNTAKEFPHPPNWMTTEEAGKAIGLSDKTLLLYINKGKSVPFANSGAMANISVLLGTYRWRN